jgi:DNA-binding SARP family transcriptional activator
MPGKLTTELRLLGDLEVRSGGARLALPASKKTRALLGYLVMTGGAAHLREHLCDLLFQGPDDPRAALRWSLTKLRGVVGDKRIVADRERVSFEGTNAACDATDVRVAFPEGVRRAPTELLRQVAARFRGELLEGLDLPDCYRYHEWCIAEREALRRVRVDVLAELVDRHAATPEAALSYARQRLAVDPITEGAHVAVVQLLAALGRNAEATEQVEACRRILARELGAKPSPALGAARVRTSEGVATVPPPAAESPPVSDGTRLAFVGRTADLAVLQSAWSATLDGKGGRAVLVTGEPGIGKTRLVAELASGIAAHGGRVLRGRAFEAEMVRPYGPWLDALGVQAEGLAGARPAVSPEPGRGDVTVAERTRVFDGVVELLEGLAGPRGCLVSLDDLQWFDEASLALLHYVARAPRAARVLVACTARGDELLESSAAIRCVRAMQRDARLAEVRLGPLDPSSTSALVRAVDAKVDADEVVVESAGNPLFALELARARARGVRTSDSLDALLADRLDRLDGRTREMLPWAAALGTSFRADVLGRVTGANDMELLTALSELEGRGVLRTDAVGSGATYDFVHDLVRDAAYKRLSSPRRQVLHRAIARALADLAAGEDAFHGDVAHHAALAGEHELAATAAVAAGERCLRMFAYDEAARTAESAMVHADRLLGPARVRLRAALLGVKVRSGRWLLRSEGLAADLSVLCDEARAHGMHVEGMRALHHLSILQRERGDLSGAHRSTQQAVTLSQGSDAESRGRQLAHSARCLVLIDRDMDQAFAMIDEAATLLPGHARDFDWCWARALERDYRDAPDAGDLLERALDLARSTEERFGEFECLMRLVQRELERGHPARALAWCRDLGPVAAKMTDGSEGVIAEALEALGRVACCVPGADGHLERAIGRLREVDAKGMLAYVLVVAAEIDREAGRSARAGERSREALAAGEAVARPTVVARARALLAELAIDRSDSGAARLHLEAVAADLERPFGMSARGRARVERAASRLT